MDIILHSSDKSTGVTPSVCILLDVFECQKSTLPIMSECATSIYTLCQQLLKQLYCRKKIVKVNAVITPVKGWAHIFTTFGLSSSQ